MVGPYRFHRLQQVRQKMGLDARALTNKGKSRDRQLHEDDRSDPARRRVDHPLLTITDAAPQTSPQWLHGTAPAHDGACGSPLTSHYNPALPPRSTTTTSDHALPELCRPAR